MPPRTARSKSQVKKRKRVSTIHSSRNRCSLTHTKETTLNFNFHLLSLPSDLPCAKSLAEPAQSALDAGNFTETGFRALADLVDFEQAERRDLTDLGMRSLMALTEQLTHQPKMFARMAKYSSCVRDLHRALVAAKAAMHGEESLLSLIHI